MKKLLVTLCCGLCLFAFTACGSGSPVAVVNGENITEKEYTTYMDNLLKIYEINGYTLDNNKKVAMKDTVIKELVNQRVIEQAAKKLDCYPSDKAVDKYFNAELSKTFGDAETGTKYIKDAGLDLDVYRYGYVVTLCEKNIGKAKVTKDSMTDAEAKAIYDENPDKYDTRQVSHILIKPDTGDRKVEKDEDGVEQYTDEEWAAAEKKAKDLIKKLDKGADFAQLAQANSADTNSAANGGSLGEPFSKGESQFVEEFTNAAFDITKANVYTDKPVKTVYGYHIIKVNALTTPKDMNKIIASIKVDTIQAQRDEAEKAYVENFQANADIQYKALTPEAQKQEDEAAKAKQAEKDAAKANSNKDKAAEKDGAKTDTTDDKAAE
ncbi:MAG: peptidylprolyl isomerase [Clostridiales bacterium]